MLLFDLRIKHIFVHTQYVDIDAVLDFSNAAILKVTCLVKGKLHYGGNEPA